MAGLLLIIALFISACKGERGGGNVTPAAVVSVSIAPATATVTVGGSQTFAATVSESANTAVTFSVQEGASGGTITAGGVYTAPTTAGTFHVIATSATDPTKA